MTTIAAISIEVIDSTENSSDDDAGLAVWTPVCRDACFTCGIARIADGEDVEHYTCARCGWSYTHCGADCDNAHPRTCVACEKTYCSECDVFRNTPCVRCGADFCEACTAEFVRGACARCSGRA
jgi:hypothetical protein